MKRIFPLPPGVCLLAKPTSAISMNEDLAMSDLRLSARRPRAWFRYFRPRPSDAREVRRARAPSTSAHTHSLASLHCQLGRPAVATGKLRANHRTRNLATLKDHMKIDCSSRPRRGPCAKSTCPRAPRLPASSSIISPAAKPCKFRQMRPCGARTSLYSLRRVRQMVANPCDGVVLPRDQTGQHHHFEVDSSSQSGTYHSIEWQRRHQRGSSRLDVGFARGDLR